MGGHRTVPPTGTDAVGRLDDMATSILHSLVRPARLLRSTLTIVLTVVVMVAAVASPAGAQSASDIAGDLDRSGSSVAGGIGADLAEAISIASASGIGYVEGDFGDGDAATALAESVAAELAGLGSTIHTVIVRSDGGVGGWSNVHGSSDVVAAIDRGFASFASGDNDAGLLAVNESLAGGGSTASSGGGVSSGVLVGGAGVVAAGGGAYWYRNKRRREQRIVDDMEADRAEINEQLRDNADKVIDLGDAVLTSGDAELQQIYTEASETYQDVSRSIEAASTPEAIDALDDRIDHAEWQFELIEARLAGEPDPKSPTELAEEAAAKQAVERSKPALGKDETIFAPPGGSTTAPRPPASPVPVPMPRGGYGRRRRSGGMGPIIIGGGGWGGGSRRSQRRHGDGGGFSGGGGGGRSFGGGGGGGRNF